MLTIDRTLNSIWRVTRPRPIAQRVLVYWAALTLGPLVLRASLTGTSYAISASQGYLDRLPSGLSTCWTVPRCCCWPAPSRASSHYVPNTHVRWRPLPSSAARLCRPSESPRPCWPGM